MNKIKWAEKKAYQLLEEHNIDTYPVPIDTIAENLKVRITKESLEDSVSGLLYRTNNVAIIGINSYHSDTRQRFTIAHELGHYIMHEGDSVHVDLKVNFRMKITSTTIDMREIEANAFAAALLMPEKLILKALNEINEDGIDLSNDSNEIKELAKLLNVSQQALLIRLGKLGLVY